MATHSLAIFILVVSTSAQESAEVPGWAALSLANGTVHVRFPAEPKKKSATIPSAVGEIGHTVHYIKTGGCLFTVQEFVYPSAVPAAQVPARLAAEQKGHVGNQELIREKAIKVDGVDGGEFEFRGPSPLGNGRVTSLTRHFFKGANYYTMTVMSAPDQPLPADAQTFMGSIHFGALKPAPAAAPNASPSPATPAPAPGRAGAAAAPAEDTPEAALRSFMTAMLNHDERALRSLVLSVTDRELEWLLKGPALPAGQAEKMRAAFAEMKIKRLKPGDRVEQPRGKAIVIARHEVGSDRAVLLPDGAPLPTRLQKVKGRWKVDARPVIAARKAAAEAAQQKGRNR